MLFFGIVQGTYCNSFFVILDILLSFSDYITCSVLIVWMHCNYWWPTPIGCLKLQVIFRKRATIYRALLWKMTYKDKASYGSSPPCIGIILVVLL